MKTKRKKQAGGKAKPREKNVEMKFCPVTLARLGEFGLDVRDYFNLAMRHLEDVLGSEDSAAARLLGDFRHMPRDAMGLSYSPIGSEKSVLTNDMDVMLADLIRRDLVDRETFGIEQLKTVLDLVPVYLLPGREDEILTWLPHVRECVARTAKAPSVLSV